MSLLSNPVLGGLLGNGPMQIRAANQQRMAQMLPQTAGGRMGAPGAIVTGGGGLLGELGSGLAGAAAALEKVDAKNKAEAQLAAENAAIEQYAGTLPPEQRERFQLAVSTPDGRKAFMQAHAKSMFANDEARTERDANGQPRFVGGPKHGQLVFDGVEVAPKPNSPVAKLKADFEAGLIDRPTYDAGVRKATHVETASPKNDSFTNEKELRKEFRDINNTFQKTAENFQKIDQAVQNATPASDIALVFSFMKMLDPTSVVRENEQATVQNAGGVPQRIRAQWNALQSGEKFTEEQRADFYGYAREVYDTKLREYDRDVKYFTDLSERYGLDPENIVRDTAYRPKGFKSAPKTQNVSTSPTVPAPPIKGPKQQPVPSQAGPSSGQMGRKQNSWADKSDDEILKELGIR